MKRKLTFILTTALSFSMTFTALAGERQWIDNNNDGVSECYYMENGTALTDTTTPDGYTVNADGQWTVDGIVQTQGATSGVNHSEGYDPAHPLATMIDEWNLRLPTQLDGLYFEVVNNNVQAMLTGQMDQYFAAPVGEYIAENGTHVYTTQEDYDKARQKEQALYQWFCDWLNGMDFEHMSEMERAQEIKKVLAQASYVDGTAGGYEYGILIEKKGQCEDYAMTACALAKAMGLKSAVNGTGNHAYYYIQVDGVAYLGDNWLLNLSTPTTDRVYF